MVFDLKLQNLILHYHLNFDFYRLCNIFLTIYQSQKKGPAPNLGEPCNHIPCPHRLKLPSRNIMPHIEL